MLNSSHQHGHAPFGLRGGANLLYVIISGHATCVTPFVRRDFGRRALGRNGVVAMLIMYGYASAYPRHVVLQQFGLCWFAMWVAQHLKTLLLAGKGITIHSRYDGYPSLGFLLPFVRKPKTAWIVEFFALLGCGIWLAGIDGPLGKLVTVSAVCLLVKTAIDEDIVRKRLQMMRDAEIEQRAIVERYRRGDF